MRWPAVWQARGSNLGPAPHGGLCLLSHSNEDFPEDIRDFLLSFLYISPEGSGSSDERNGRMRTHNQNPLVRDKIILKTL